MRPAVSRISNEGLESRQSTVGRRWWTRATGERASAPCDIDLGAHSPLPDIDSLLRAARFPGPSHERRRDLPATLTSERHSREPCRCYSTLTVVADHLCTHANVPCRSFETVSYLCVCVSCM